MSTIHPTSTEVETNRAKEAMRFMEEMGIEFNAEDVEVASEELGPIIAMSRRNY